jgi:hypothetical protein
LDESPTKIVLASLTFLPASFSGIENPAVEREDLVPRAVLKMDSKAPSHRGLWEFPSECHPLAALALLRVLLGSQQTILTAAFAHSYRRPTGLMLKLLRRQAVKSGDFEKQQK